ncbi:hypothetical protein RR46_05502 [Papilio xuthus]|uniref:Uncharacterized protein n=1 Tax=Papilio xuthus TaxID=66420 RepID=A0A194Q1W3_PAPXU|nr:hypothetical protein RR46_05502 [Papilio xuthus]
MALTRELIPLTIGSRKGQGAVAPRCRGGVVTWGQSTEGPGDVSWAPRGRAVAPASRTITLDGGIRTDDEKIVLSEAPAPAA